MTAIFPVHTNRRVAWLAMTSLLSLAAIWGATFFMVKDATQTFPVLAFLALRFTISSVALAPVTLIPMIRNKRWPGAAEWRWGIGAGILFCAGYIFQTFSLRLIDSGRTGFITGLYVVMVPVLALVFLRYLITRRVFIGGVLALIGMVLLGYAPGSNLTGDLLAIACAFSFASHILVVEKMPRDADWRFMALVQSATVMIICVVLLPVLANTKTGLFAAFSDALPTEIPLLVWGATLFTGLLATAGGLIVQVWAQRHIPPSNAALIFALESPFSAVFGIVFRNEALTTIGLIGCTLIFAGMLVTTLTGQQPVHQPQLEQRAWGRRQSRRKKPQPEPVSLAPNKIIQPKED